MDTSLPSSETWPLLPAPHVVAAGLGLVGGAIASLDALVGIDADGDERFAPLSPIVPHHGMATLRPFWLLRGWEPVSKTALLLAFNVRAGLADGAWPMDSAAGVAVLDAHVAHFARYPTRLCSLTPHASRPTPRRRHPRIERMERRLASGEDRNFVIIDERDLSPAPRSATIRSDLVRLGRRLYGVPASPSLKRSIVIDGRIASDKRAFEAAIEHELERAASFGRAPRAPSISADIPWAEPGEAFLEAWG